MSLQPYYWTDPWKDQFDVELKSVVERNGKICVIINEHVVKPEGGGQAGDRGYLFVNEKQYEFIDTILDDEELVLILNKKPSISKGKVKLQIDMSWRRAMMSNHTAEHIFVGSMKKRYPDIKLGRIWIDGEHGTITLEGRILSLEEVLVSEDTVNDIIWQAIDVMTNIVTAGDIDESVRAREGVTSNNSAIRLVNVGYFDSSACSGVHVTNTKDILIFKVTDVKTQGKDTHIEFLTGSKAISKLIEIYNFALSRKYSFPYEIEQLGAVLDKSKILQEAYDQALEKIRDLMQEGPTKEVLGDVTFWYEYLPGFDMSELRYLIKSLELSTPSLTLFLTTGKKTNIIVWTKSMKQDASFYISEIVTELGGRGGGSSDSYTGGFTEVENPEILFQTIVERVKEKLLL